MDLTRLKEQTVKKAEQNRQDIKHAETIDTMLQSQEVLVRSFKSLIDYLNRRVGRTEVVNQLTEIGTPDALKVVDAVNDLHQTIGSRKEVDLSQITQILKLALAELQKVPKSVESIDIPEPIDHSKQFKSLEEAIKTIEKAIKAQKLTVEAPVVNVPAPNVNVETDLKPVEKRLDEVRKAVKAIIIPKPVPTDTTKLEKELKTANKHLKDLVEKPVSGGGGGGGRATPYEDTNGIPAFVTTINGALPTDKPTYKKLIDESTTPNVTYIGEAEGGSATSASVWRIKQIDESSGVAITFAGRDFSSVWDDRVTEVYT